MIITDSVFDESYEPLSAQSIEEPRYVGIENPVDFTCINSVCERIQRIRAVCVRAATHS
jgi:hypothetical protein